MMMKMVMEQEKRVVVLLATYWNPMMVFVFLHSAGG